MVVCGNLQAAMLEIKGFKNTHVKDKGDRENVGGKHKNVSGATLVGNQLYGDDP